MDRRLSRDNFIAGYLITLAMTFLISDALSLELGRGVKGSAALLVWGGLHFFAGRKRQGRAVIMLAASAVVLVLLAPIWGPVASPWGVPNLMHRLSENLGNLVGLELWDDLAFYAMEAAMDSGAVREAVFAFDMALFIACAAAFGSITYSLSMGRHYRYFLIPFALFIQQWFQYSEHVQVYFSLYFIGFIIRAGSYTRERTLEMDRASAYGAAHFNARRYGVYLIVLGAFLLIVSQLAYALIPIDEINRAIGESVPNVLNMRTGYERGSMALYSFNQSGYQPYSERLGGPVERTENPVMLRVWSDKAGLYLRGRVKTRYTGRNWTSDHITYRNQNDYAQLTGAVDSGESAFHLSVVPEGIQTRTLFVPVGLRSVELDKEKVFMNPDGAVYYKRDTFEDPPGIYSMRGVSYSMHIEDRQSYLGLPESFDTAVTDLALELTRDAVTDLEKMEILRNWLRDTYPYNLKTSIPPADADFVAYFLFEEKSGYCTYFASALATMGRAAGVPTRYVEGFLVPLIRQPDGSFAVRADRAHAWTEAYIEGHGWRVFEATPAYSTGTLSRELEQADTQTGVQVPDSEMSTGRLEAMEDMLEVDLSDVATGRTLSGQNRDYIYAAVWAMLAVGAVFSVASFIRMRRYYYGGALKTRAYRWVYYLEDLMGLDGPWSVAEKVGIYISSHPNSTAFGQDPCVIMNLIRRALYSGSDISEEALEQLQTAALSLEKETKGRSARLVYWQENRNRQE